MDIFVNPDAGFRCNADQYAQRVIQEANEKVYLMKLHMRPYEDMINSIVDHRNAALQERGLLDEKSITAWVYTEWSGPMVMMPLLKEEKFSDFQDYLDLFQARTEQLLSEGYDQHRPHAPVVTQPVPEDFPQAIRRSWKYQVGNARATLSLLGEHSDHCRLEKVGADPLYKIDCGASNG